MVRRTHCRDVARFCYQVPKYRVTNAVTRDYSFAFTVTNFLGVLKSSFESVPNNSDSFSLEFCRVVTWEVLNTRRTDARSRKLASFRSVLQVTALCLIFVGRVKHLFGISTHLLYR